MSNLSNSQCAERQRTLLWGNHRSVSLFSGTPANVRAAFPHIEAQVKKTALDSVDCSNGSVNGGHHVIFHRRKLCLPVSEIQLVDVLEEADLRFGKSVRNVFIL